ncbi:Co2+/Mg2+ efflux protein ApaG [Thiolapillus sp.]
MKNTPKHDIKVDIETTFIRDQSDIEAGRYVFGYTITISNQGGLPAKLLNRHWIITDANGKVEEVRGEGVVGEQPYLEPGQQYRYSSGAIIETPVGAMEGDYEMLDAQGEHFLAPIPAFSLQMPNAVH